MVYLATKFRLRNKKIKKEILKKDVFLILFLFCLIFFGNFKEIFAQEAKIVVADGKSKIIFYDLRGNIYSFFYLPKSFHGKINFEVSDFNNDFINEIIILSNDGKSIAIFSEKGVLQRLLTFENKKENKNLSQERKFIIGDLNDDGKKEIVLVEMPYIKIFDQNAKLKEKFLLFSKNWRGEIEFGIGDIDRDRKDEIVFLNNKNPERMFIYKNKKIFSRSLNFFSKKSFSKNFSIDVGDLEGDGKMELGICDFAIDSNCQILFFNRRNIIWPNNLNFNDNLILKIKDIDDDGHAEVIIAEKFGGRISIYKINRTGNVSFWRTIYTSLENKEQLSFSDFSTISDLDIFFSNTKKEAKVIYVDDGDTIFLDSGYEVRYIGMDTPEIGERNYLEATNKNKELTYDKKITLEFDKQRIDPYGRLLGYIFVDGKFVNEELVKAGLARVKFVYPNVKYAKRLLKAERKSKFLERKN